VPEAAPGIRHRSGVDDVGGDGDALVAGAASAEDR
jgi:hypothetical protein